MSQRASKNYSIATDRQISKMDRNQTADTVRVFPALWQIVDAHLEDGRYREILLHSAVTKFVLFGATGLSRSGQVVQRPDCRCWSAEKMIAQYRYWSDLSRPHFCKLSLS